MQEQADGDALGVAHLVDANVGVVRGDLGAGDERQAEQARGAIERRADHALEREVGLDLGLVEVVALAPHLLGVEAPVPGLDRRRAAVRSRHRRELGALVFGPRPRRLPDALEQACHRRLVLGHGVAEGEVGIAGVAVQPRLLEAQLQDLLGQAAVVARAGMLAARGPCPPGLLAQIAALGKRQERHDVRARERDHRDVAEAALACRLARRGANEVGQAGQVGFVREDELELRLVGEHVLAEARRQLGQALHQLGIAGALGRRQLGTGANEVEVVALEHARLLAAQAERGARGVQRVEAREQRGVRVDAAVVAWPGSAPSRARPPAAPATSRSR